MSRTIYTTDVTNLITHYRYAGVSDSYYLYVRTVTGMLNNTSENWEYHLWQPASGYPTYDNRDIPYRDTGYCVLDEGRLALAGTPEDPGPRVNDLFIIRWSTSYTNGTLLNSNWTGKGFRMDSYETFSDDVAVHLNRAPATYMNINALVFYNLRILDLINVVPPPEGQDFPLDQYISGFWAYWGNDPAAPKITVLAYP